MVYKKPYVLLDTLEVKNGDAALVADSDYIAAHDNDGNVLITILSQAAKEAPTLSVASKSLNPAGVTRADVVGGVDALTGQETGMELIRHIYPKLGMVPGLLLAPGWSGDAVVAAALQAKTEAINGVFVCNCLLDIPTDGENGAAVYTDAKVAKEKMGASSNHAMALWPMVAVGDKIYHYSAMFGALTAYTDATNADVPYESPSNKDLRITATVLADGTEVVLDQQQANDMLNANGITTAINMNGFKSWGNKTAAYLIYATLGDYVQSVPPYSEEFPAAVWNFPLTTVISDEIDVIASAPAGLVTFNDLLAVVEDMSIRRLDIVIPASGWREEPENAYPYRLDIGMEVKCSMIPMLTVLPPDIGRAATCGLAPFAQTTDGALQVWAKRIPEAALHASLVLLRDASGLYMTGSSGSLLPPATPTTLGGVKIGPGLNVTSDGTLSVDTASRASKSESPAACRS